MNGYINRQGKFANFEKSFVFFLGTQKYSKLDVSFGYSCCLHVSFCLSRVGYQVRSKLL